MQTMHRRTITMPDGRYMIFYTFGQSAPLPEGDRDAGKKSADSEEKPDHV